MRKADGEESTDVVEMDAMDVVEWEREQHTPIAPDSNLAALVKQSAQSDEKSDEPKRTTGAIARSSRPAMPVPLGDKPADGLPRATKPSLLAAAAAAAEDAQGPSSRVPNATIPTPQPLMQQLLKGPTKNTTQRTPRLASATVPTPPAIQETLARTEKAAQEPAPAPATAATAAEAEPAGGWEELDDSWDESPKSSSTKADAKAYSAPTTPRVTTSNTVRRDNVRKTGSHGAEQSPATPPRTPMAKSVTRTQALPTVAAPRSDAKIDVPLETPAQTKAGRTATPAGGLLPLRSQKPNGAAPQNGTAKPAVAQNGAAQPVQNGAPKPTQPALAKTEKPTQPQPPLAKPTQPQPAIAKTETPKPTQPQPALAKTEAPKPTQPAVAKTEAPKPTQPQPVIAKTEAPPSTQPQPVIAKNEAPPGPAKTEPPKPEIVQAKTVVVPAPIAQAKTVVVPAQAKTVVQPAPEPVRPTSEALLRASEPALLPPPPTAAAEPASRLVPFIAPISRSNDDWDGMAPSKPSAPKKPIARPINDFGDDEEDREPSVIIDLNAKPVAPKDLDWGLAAAALAADAMSTSNSGPQMPIQTSELNTTASGVFVMPTAASPMGKLKSSPAIRLPPVEPVEEEDTAALPPIPPDDDLEIPRLAAPEWVKPKPAPAANDWSSSPATSSAAPAFQSAPAPAANDWSSSPATSSAAPAFPSPKPETYPTADAASSAWPPPVAKPPGVAFAFAPATQQSAPLPRAPSVAELGWEHDPAIPQPLAHVEQTERRIVPRTLIGTVLPTPKAKRLAVIIGSAAVVLILVIVLATSGKSSTAATPPVAEATVKPPAPAPEPPKVAVVDPPTPAPPPAAVEPPPAAVEPTKVDPPKPPVRRYTKPAKPLVLDYDTKPKPDATPAAPTPDQALARARASYAAGNQHLFAGEADAAIASYKQALAVYPGYVAGYRGLGLAYAQQGDREAALKAFQTYVGLVPNAKDVALIQKRIARLSGQ